MGVGPQVLTTVVRDESFITTWGGLYSGGGRKFLGDVLGGVENKMTHGQGRSCILSGIGGGGVRCVPLVFLFNKSHSFWGGYPPISQLYNVRLSEPLGDIGNKICPILAKQKSFSSDIALCF